MAIRTALKDSAPLLVDRAGTPHPEIQSAGIPRAGTRVASKNKRPTRAKAFENVVDPRDHAHQLGALLRCRGLVRGNVTVPLESCSSCSGSPQAQRRRPAQPVPPDGRHWDGILSVQHASHPCAWWSRQRPRRSADRALASQTAMPWPTTQSTKTCEPSAAKRQHG